MRYLLALLVWFIPALVFAGVVFEDDFENKTWNTNGALDGKECAYTTTELGQCASTNDYPTGGYNFLRLVPGGTANPISPQAFINTLPSGPDHTKGTTDGRAFVVQQNGTTTTNGFTNDGQIGKWFGASTTYPELYVRLWMKTNASYQSIASSLIKIFRLGSWGGNNATVWSWDVSQTPAMFFDVGTYGGSWPNWAGWSFSPRCGGDGSGYYCPHPYNGDGSDYGSLQDWNYAGGNYPYSPGGWGDGSWHRYDLHVKYSDPGVSNGYFSFAFDGANMASYMNFPATTVPFSTAGSTKTGFNLFSIGGNTNNYAGSAVNQWYAIDDVVISTTAIPVDYVIGGGTGTGTGGFKHASSGSFSCK